MSSRPHHYSADQLAAFKRAAFDPKIHAYPGTLKIKKALRLTLAQREIEARFAAQLEADLEYFVDKYRRDYGSVLNTDNARELSSDYCKSRKTRAVHSASVQEPASALVKEIWHRMLAEEKSPSDDFVLFLAGGGGSGKTRATEEPGLKELKSQAQIIFDTTMADTLSSIRKVEEALNAGKRVAVRYIHRPIEQAITGVVARAVKEGRVVPVNVLAHDHFNAQATIIALAKRYRGEASVDIAVLNNSREGPSMQEVSVDHIEHNRYHDLAELRRRIEEVIKHEYKRRKGRADILPDDTFQAFFDKTLDR